MKEKRLQDEAEERIRLLKNKAAEYEIQKRTNVKTIKDEYSDFLSNQMKEKQYTQDVINQEKQNYSEDIKLKYKMMNQNDERQKQEKHDSQLAYRELLHEQERFKNAHPENSLKVTESPERSEVSRMPSSSYRHHGLQQVPSNSSLQRHSVPSQNIEPVGPINANIGHKSKYIGPNPILTPISDPLYNPYVRREVTNSVHDGKKRSIYMPPNSIVY